MYAKGVKFHFLWIIVAVPHRERNSVHKVNATNGIATPTHSPNATLVTMIQVRPSRSLFDTLPKLALSLVLAAMCAFSVGAPSTANAQAGAIFRMQDAGSTVQGVEYLARYYRQQRVVGGTTAIVSGAAFTTIGLLELTDTTDLFGRAFGGSVMLVSGMSAITMGALQLTGPIGDEEVTARRLTAATDVPESQYRAFIAQRAGLARRGRIISSTTLMLSGVGLFVSGAVYDFEANGFESRRAGGYYTAGAIMTALSITTAILKSPEERLARQLNVERLRLRGTGTNVSAAPLFAQARGEMFSGVSLRFTQR